MTTNTDNLNIYEFMQSLNISAESYGVDAVTITAMGLGGKLTLGFIMDSLSEQFSVEDEQKFFFKGAEGFQRGPFRYAAKWNSKHQMLWAIFMVTGGVSDKVFSEAILYDTGDLKFTRLDIRCDVQLTEITTSLAHRLYLANKHKVESQYISSITGDTVYFGKRTGSSFVRIYDKSLEYGERLGTVWRFELEAKKMLAHNIAMELASVRQAKRLGQTENDFFGDILWGKMREMGLPTPRQGTFPNIKSTNVTLSSNEMRLNWLRSRVRGTVRGLVASGYGEQVGNALGVQLKLDIETV